MARALDYTKARKPILRKLSTPFMVFGVTHHSELRIALTFYCQCKVLPDKDVDVFNGVQYFDSRW